MCVYVCILVLLGEISVWSVNEQKCLYQWKCHSEAVSHLLAGGDCLLMTATEQGSITVWKICTDHMMYVCRSHDACVLVT